MPGTFTHRPRWTIVVIDPEGARVSAHGLFNRVEAARDRAVKWNRAFHTSGRRCSALVVPMRPATADVRDEAWPVPTGRELPAVRR